jgi:hypothetical protein
MELSEVSICSCQEAELAGDIEPQLKIRARKPTNIALNNFMGGRYPRPAVPARQNLQYRHSLYLL